MRYLRSSLLGFSFLTAVVSGGPPSAFAQRPQELRALPRAADLVDRYGEVLSFCEPCGDMAPGIPLQVEGTSAVLARGAGELYVVVNGQELPLQSTYVRTEAGWFRNLALLLGVAADGVTPSLRVEHAGTSGELITASSRVPKRDPAPAALASAPPAPAPPPTQATAEPSVVVIHQSEGGGNGLALLALLLSGLASSGMLWVFVAAWSRRRRAAVPRAIHLPK